MSIEQTEIYREIRKRIGAGSEGLISPPEIAKLFEETGLLAMVEEQRARRHKDHPPVPPMPDGAPRTFLDAIHTGGLCAIPVWTERLGRWRFLCLYDGAGIRNIDTGEWLAYDSYEKAIEMLHSWYEAVGPGAKG